MTQRELAEQLYVTESAVSKWERGLSYPDITLLQNICSVLQVSEHELLSGSEDTSRRVSEKLADKYLRLTRNYRIAQYIIYGLILLGCAAGNLAAQHTLDWFFIVAAGVMMAASLALVPSLAAMHVKLENSKPRWHFSDLQYPWSFCSWYAAWTAPFLFDRIMSAYFGDSDSLYSLAIPFDFSEWDTEHTAFNVIMLILIALGVLAAVFACIGAVERKNEQVMGE